MEQPSLDNNQFFKCRPSDEFVVQEQGFGLKIVPHEGPRLPYSKKLEIDDKQRGNLLKKAGQLKLFYAHLQFLLQLLERFGESVRSAPVTIIYVGAAPGASLPFVDTLVSGYRWIEQWHLYDKNAFRGYESTNERFCIHSEFFNDVKAEQLAVQNKKFVFMSDIRVSDSDSNLIMKDQTDQDRWAKILACGRGELLAYWRKIRTPYENIPHAFSTIKWVGYDQQCIGPRSTEIRGISWQEDIQQYINNPDAFQVDLRWLEEYMFHYNIKNRQTKLDDQYGWLHNVRYPGLCYCHDCNQMIRIWREWLRLMQNNDQPTTRDVINMFKITDETFAKLGLTASVMRDPKSPHGRDPHLPLSERQRKWRDMAVRNQKRKEKNRQKRLQQGDAKICGQCSEQFKPAKHWFRICSQCNRKNNRRHRK